ncbi:hypothetical protein GCM10009773_28650 [Williamsia serinedens]
MLPRPREEPDAGNDEADNRDRHETRRKKDDDAEEYPGENGAGSVEIWFANLRYEQSRGGGKERENKAERYGPQN